MTTWFEKMAKFVMSSSARPQHCCCRRRRCRLEPHGEEHHLAFRVLGCDSERVEGRVDDPDVRALCLGAEKAAVRAGHPHHVAERGEDEPGRLGHGDGVVDPAHRDDTHWTTGTVHQLDRGREKMLNPMTINRVRVTTTDLHEFVVALSGELGDVGHQGPRCRWVSVLVDKSHEDTPSGTDGTQLAARHDWRPGPPARPAYAICDPITACTSSV